MDRLNAKKLRTDATQTLAYARQPRRLMLIHSGVIVALQVVLVLLNYFLQEGIAATGGLAGLGTRSVLTTLQTMLQILTTVLLPFWQMGLYGAVLMLHRREYVQGGDLLCGFKRFGPVLGLQLWRFFLLFAVMMACSHLASMLFMMTPAGQEFEAAMLPYVSGTMIDYEAMMNMDTAVLLELMRPMLYIFAVLAIPATVLMLYLTRFAKYAVMDTPGTRAFPALLRSIKLSFRNFGRLLRLDLSFWWYYLLQVLLLALGYGDLMAASFVSADANMLYYVAFAAQAVATLVVAVLVQLRVEVTYAAAYKEMEN